MVEKPNKIFGERGGKNELSQGTSSSVVILVGGPAWAVEETAPSFLLGFCDFLKRFKVEEESH